jgi:hypothetical protein
LLMRSLTAANAEVSTAAIKPILLMGSNRFGLADHIQSVYTSHPFK